ncbi:MAG: hypothetical protein LBS72_07235, partial [Oscillospiraceae bacterium]|nr:hypothetical protein [Oscillospiraceae bacterium]
MPANHTRSAESRGVRVDGMTLLWIVCAILALASGACWWTAAAYALGAAASKCAVGVVGRYARGWKRIERWMFIAAVCFAAVALAVARLTGEGASAGLA